MTPSIVYLSVASFPSHSAHARYSEQLCCALARLGLDVTLLGCAGRGKESGDESKFLASNMRVIRLPTVPFSPSSRAWSVAALACISAAKWKSSIVITHNAATAAALRSRSVPFVYDFHAVPCHGRLLGYALKGKLRSVIYNCNRMQNSIEGRYGLNVPSIVLGSGVSEAFLNEQILSTEARQKFNLPENRPILAYIGSLGEGRGIDQMLSVAAELQCSSKDLYWLFVGGSSSDVLHWERLAREKGLHVRNFRFIGHCPSGVLPALHRAADVLVAPYSARLSTSDVMFPMKLLEYQAIGRPIIASDLPAVREALRNNPAANYFERDNPDSLRRSVEQFLSREEELIAIAEDSRIVCKNDTWDAKATSLANFLFTH